jgi:hypothetical protein
VSGNRASGAFPGIGVPFTTAGIGAYRASPILIGNVVANNLTTNSTAALTGAGICLVASTNARVVNNTILRNQAINSDVVQAGSGFLVKDAAGLEFANNLVVSNASGLYVEQATPTLRNNCIFGNGPLEYVGLRDPTGQAGNLAVDPQLGGSDGFHLATNSPCVDAGANDAADLAVSDFDGEARLQGAFVDIGADEAAIGTAWRPAFEPPMGIASLTLTNVGGITYASLEIPFPDSGYQMAGPASVVVSDKSVGLDARILTGEGGIVVPDLQTNRSVSVLGALPAGEYAVALTLWSVPFSAQTWTVPETRDATLVDVGWDAFGDYRFTVLGVPMVDYRVQVSEDLTSWTDVYTNHGGPFIYSGAPANGGSQSYHRVLIGASP